MLLASAITPQHLPQQLGLGLLQDDWWAHLDLNQGPMDYESTALTTEL